MSLKEELFTAIIKATLLEGRIYVVESGGEIATMCLVFRKPASLFGSEAQKALGFTEVFEKLDPKTQHWWKNQYPAQMAEKEKTIISQEEWDKMWYFSMVATDPKHQNKGFASHLMNTFFDEVNKNGDIFGLSTGSEVNVPKYETMGFKERGRIVMKTPVNEFPCVWLTRG
ncbi:hypothetical protein BDY19DRAFT_916754 [Irpex rosettiformis]|uniref:Uncharacterized protein n=1 Tax=Irpex rosettiformis TaxID=378272 RepID=A0ACB8ULH0_9APHY|nr:hypothetical protein BDY19DRAFT_916754 [Irpex rosettiformis]